VKGAFDFLPTLEGQLLRLRPMQRDDHAPLIGIAADPLLWSQHPIPERQQPEVMSALLDDAWTDQGSLVLVDRADGAIIGHSRYSTRYAHSPEEIEIGWTFLARTHWGRGFNAEAKQLMVAHALTHYAQVFFRVGEDNLRSRRAMEKLGARLTPRVYEATAFGRDLVYVTYVLTGPCRS
jgi:RimJ/RimL family protein N-acetyltransferase